MNLIVCVVVSLTSLILIVSSVNCQVKQASSIGGISLDQKVKQLLDWNEKKSILSLNGYQFNEYVKSTPRNYSVIVMFTALHLARQCIICRPAFDEYTILANSYRYSSSYSNNLFFAIVDIDGGSDVFQMLRLNTAPVLMHFPPKGKLKRRDTMDIQRMGISAEAMAKWVYERSEIQIRIFRPRNYNTGAVAVIMFISFFGGLLYVQRNKLEFLQNKQLWGLLSLLFVLSMISGQMWNHIRSPPFVYKRQNGGVGYIQAGSQGQFVVETYIVMVLNGLVAIGIIMLTESGKHSDPRKGKLMAVIGLLLVAIFFSLLLFVFRSKAYGYSLPFSL